MAVNIASRFPDLSVLRLVIKKSAAPLRRFFAVLWKSWFEAVSMLVS
jgi:hypothetical protein